MNSIDVDLGENGQVEYILNSDNDMFAVNGMTGEVTVTRALTEADQGVHHKLTIIASDKGRYRTGIHG